MQFVAFVEKGFEQLILQRQRVAVLHHFVRRQAHPVPDLGEHGPGDPHHGAARVRKRVVPAEPVERRPFQAPADIGLVLERVFERTGAVTLDPTQPFHGRVLVARFGEIKQDTHHHVAGKRDGVVVLVADPRGRAPPSSVRPLRGADALAALGHPGRTHKAIEQSKVPVVTMRFRRKSRSRGTDRRVAAPDALARLNLGHRGGANWFGGDGGVKRAKHAENGKQENGQWHCLRHGKTLSEQG